MNEDPRDPAFRSDTIDGSDPDKDDGGSELTKSSELMAGRFFALAANLATQVVLVRILTKDDFGALSLGLSIALLAETFVALGLDRAVSRYLAMYDENGESVEARGLLRAVALVMIVGTFAMALVGLFVLRSTGSVEQSLAVALLAVAGPLLAADSVLIAILSVFSRSRLILARRFIMDPTLRLVAVAVTGVADLDLEWLAGAYLLIGLGGTIWLWAGARSALREPDLYPFGRSAVDDPRWNFQPIVFFALPLFSNDLVQVIVSSLDALSVGALGSLEDVATLRAVQPLARLNQLVLLSFGYLFVPTAARKLARGQDVGVGDWYWRATISVVLLTWPVFVFTFGGSDVLVSILFGDRYESSEVVLAVLAAGHFAHVVFGFNGMTLNVFAKVRTLVVVNLAALAVGLTLNLVLISRYGAVGAAAAVALTLVTHNVLRQLALVLTTPLVGVNREQRLFFAVVAGSVSIVVGAKLLELGWMWEVGLGAVLGGPMLVAARRCVDLRALNPLADRRTRR